MSFHGSAATRALLQPVPFIPPPPSPSFRADRARLTTLGALCVLWWCVFCPRAFTQERAYFLTYDHYLEEAGNLEFEYASTLGTQRAGHGFHAFWAEFDYGATGWWTTELYLDGQTTFSDGTLFTGFRWENRFRLLAHEQFINPVIYVEYEQIDGADKILKEVEGHDVESDYSPSNAALRQERKHELELKLLLSKSFRGWNVAANPIVGKNLTPGAPWELGYAVGVSRALAVKASPTPCSFCSENFTLGLELYGGLGDSHAWGLAATSHYLAPVAAWNLPAGWALRWSTAFGLNRNSHGVVVRWGVSRELSDFAGNVARLFGRAGASATAESTGQAHHHAAHDHYAELANVPGKASAARNPLETDPNARAAGAKLFQRHCAECHGETGGGTRRGPSLLAEQVRTAAPGALFWILSNGVVRHGMPDWSNLPELERWQIVAFVKTLQD